MASPSDMGLIPLQVDIRDARPDDELVANIRAAMALGLPRLSAAPPESRRVALVGGGPSLRSSLGAVARLKAEGAAVFSVNEVGAFLTSNGISPDASVHVGPVEYTTRCIGMPIRGVRYYIASICPPSSFGALAGHDVTVWHAETLSGAVNAVLRADGGPLIGGGHTVGLRAIAMCWALGYRRFDLFGYDSSADPGLLHAYESVSDAVSDRRIAVRCGGTWFETAPEFARQALDFEAIWQGCVAAGGEIRVHGSGLLPAIWREVAAGRTAPTLLREDRTPPEPIVATQF
jgi:hypothetical protein